MADSARDRLALGGPSLEKRMTRGRSIVRMATWPATVAGLLVGVPLSFASDQGTFLDLVRALQNVAEISTQRAISPGAPDVVTSTMAAEGTGLNLLGVVIAGETRLALVQLAATSSSGPELVPVGGFVGGYHLTDVEENQVTLEGQHGERMILRLQTGGGASGETAPSAPAGLVEAPKVTDSIAVDRAELIRAKETRSARRAERDVQQKARDLAERAASGQAGQPVSEPER